MLKQFDHEPKTREVIALLKRRKKLLRAILSDHNRQFREKWKDGTDGTMLNRTLSIRPILRTKAKSGDAYVT